MLAPESTDRIALLRWQVARLERGARPEAAPCDDRKAGVPSGRESGLDTRGDGARDSESWDDDAWDTGSCGDGVAPVGGRGGPVRLSANGAGRRPGVRNAWAGPETSAIAFGHREVDAVTHGLARGVLHDVTPAGAPDMAAATGFALALVGRLMAAAGRHALWLWVREEMARREAGEPYGPGLAAFGLDPARLVTVAAADTVDVLRAAEEGLGAGAFAAVLIEPYGDDRRLDLTACRRLSLIAGDSRATGVLLRTGGVSGPTSAITRWTVAAAPSRTGGRHPGNPLFSAELVRNRLGPVGAFMMEWRSDEQSFRAPAAADGGRMAAALSGRLAAAPAGRAAAAAGTVLAFPGR